MADNLSVNTAGGGTALVRTTDAGGIHTQWLKPGGAPTGTSGAYTVTTTATAHVSANANRRRIILQNLSDAVRVRFGSTSGITTSNAPFIEKGDSLNTEVTSTIYLMAESGTVTVAYWEEVN